MESLPPVLRRLGALAVAAALLAGCQGGELVSPTEAQDKAKDDEAKLQYYKDAAKTYFEGEKYDASAKMWEKVLELKPGDQWAKFGLARSLQRIGTVGALRRSEKILVELEGLDWTHPTQGNVKFRVDTALATVYSDLADYYDRDVRELDARLEHERIAEQVATLRKNMQKQIATRNDLQSKAIPLWESVLKTSDEDPYALAGLSKAYLVLGDDSRGVEYGKRYVDLSRRSQEGWAKKLKAWEKLQGKEVTQEQRAFYARKIQGARQKEKSMMLLLGSVFMRRQEYADAVEAYDRVLEVDPAFPAAYLERAQAYARLSQYARAVTDLEEYLKLTDPVKQREARLGAAELLDRYRKIADRGGAMTPASLPAAPSGPTATPPPPAPAPVR